MVPLFQAMILSWLKILQDIDTMSLIWLLVSCLPKISMFWEISQSLIQRTFSSRLSSGDKSQEGDAFISFLQMFYNNCVLQVIRLIMNHSKDPKNSSRLSASHTNHNSTSDFKRRGGSLTKKPTEELLSSPHSKSKYLIGWGNLPSFPNLAHQIQTINKDIAAFSCGEEHIVFVNDRGKAFGVGKNQFGQLGTDDHKNCRQIIVPVFEGYRIKKVYCTAFSTFFLTDDNKLYACGLNNRGQLGVGSKCEKVTRPLLVASLLKPDGPPERLGKKNSRSRISSVYYQQLKQSISNEYADKNGSFRSKGIINQNQTIRDIRGGPFHTIIITSNGRVLYSGNLYNTASLKEGHCLTQFTPLNTEAIGNVVMVKSFLTGYGLLNIDNKLYLLGHFSQHIFDEPYLLYPGRVTSFDINSKGIYVVDAFGELMHFNSTVAFGRGQKIPTKEQVLEVFCGLDYVIASFKDNSIHGIGDNSQNQLCSFSRSSSEEMVDLGLELSEESKINLRCTNNFILCLVSKPISPGPQRGSQQQLSRIKELERQTKVLKQLLCNKNKKNVKVQTEKEGKFQFSKVLNPRTFDGCMEIPFEQITLGKQISEGGYGIIYKATWRKSTVAIKLFKIDQENQNSIRDFISQCHAMQALRHPNIVMFLGACTKPPNFAIVLQYCEGGTLWTLLQKHSQELSWKDRRNLALDVARGMNYLHERPTPILHRDLKSLNLLLDGSGRVKLADFGWTKSLQNYMTGKIGTYQWMAPEVISALQYTQKADIYSFGIILWEIASREAPYRNTPGPQVAQDVLSKGLRPLIPKKTPQCFAELIQRCWQKQASVRPSFSTIISMLQQMKFS